MFINKINNCCYVGSSVNLSKRMATHFFHARSNQETNIVVSRALRKYGLENFSLAILEFCSAEPNPPIRHPHPDALGCN